jgi:lysyl-tRNA synthetase class II
MFSNTEDQVFARHIRQYNDGEPVHVIGRVLSYRKMGGVAFGHISDNSDAKIQFAFNKKMMDEANFRSGLLFPILERYCCRYWRSMDYLYRRKDCIGQ